MKEEKEEEEEEEEKKVVKEGQGLEEREEEKGLVVTTKVSGQDSSEQDDQKQVMVVVVEGEEEEEEESDTSSEPLDYVDGDHRHNPTSSGLKPKRFRHIPISLLPATTGSVLSAVAASTISDGDLTAASQMTVEELLKEQNGGQEEAGSPQSLTSHSEGSSLEELGLPEDLTGEKECGPEIPAAESNPPKEEVATSEWLRGVCVCVCVCVVSPM